MIVRSQQKSCRNLSHDIVILLPISPLSRDDRGETYKVVHCCPTRGEISIRGLLYSARVGVNDCLPAVSPVLQSKEEERTTLLSNVTRDGMVEISLSDTFEM